MREKWGAKRPVQAGAKVAGLPHDGCPISRASLRESGEQNAPLKQTQSPRGPIARPMREKWGRNVPLKPAQGPPGAPFLARPVREK